MAQLFSNFNFSVNVWLIQRAPNLKVNKISLKFTILNQYIRNINKHSNYFFKSQGRFIALKLKFKNALRLLGHTYNAAK